MLEGYVVHENAKHRGTATAFSEAEREQGCDHCGCECSKHKDTPRSQEFQKDLYKRINRAIGQLNGVKSMLDDNRYCGDILVQLSAAESAVHRVSEMLLQNHMETCVVEQIQQGNTEIIDEAMGLIRKFGGTK